MLVLTYLPTGQKIIFRGADKPKRLSPSSLAVAIVNIYGMRK
jgi:phage terminase large subunit